MKSIRRGVFETNSSSTHSITMCSKEDFDAWKNGKVIFEDSYNGAKFISIESAMKKLKEESPEVDFDDKDAIEDALLGLEFYTYERYFESEYLEGFETEKTINGVAVVAFGKYGYDG